MDGQQPQPRQTTAPEVAMHDAPPLGLSTLVDSQQPSQAAAGLHYQASSHGTNGTCSPASAPASSNHNTPGPPQLPPLPSAQAPLPPPGPAHHPSVSTPRPIPSPGPVPSGKSPVASSYYDQREHHRQQPRRLNHGQQQPSPVHHGKMAIVDPPRATRRVSDAKFSALQSPTRDHARVKPKFIEDVSRLTHAVQQSLPEAVRRVARENWEKTLMGSDFHQAFVMSVGFHNANPAVLQRTVSDSGRKMVSQTRHELIQHFDVADLDTVADVILNKASDQFLDKALERRLATIDARSLINALARNERLGYESNEVDSHAAPAPPTYPAQLEYQTQPSYPPQPAHPTLPPYQVQQPALLPKPPGGSGPQSLQCQLCWRKFQALSAYEFHTKKRVCTKPAPDANGFPFNCPFCGTGFVTQVGKNYHHANKVCGDHGMAPATPKAPASPIVLSTGTNSPVPMPPSTTPMTATPASQAIPTAGMSQPSFQASPNQVPLNQSSPALASTPLSSQYVPSSDPYAHLKPATRAKLDEELRQAELLFKPRFQELDAIEDENERLKKQEGLQNSFSTKQSIIRKKYGVRLRQRRTKAVIDAERVRVTGHTVAFSRKRQRTDSDAPSSSLPNAMDASPSPHLSVADMNSAGLGGSGATAATADPTAEPTPSRPAPPRNSLASYQRIGYRIDTHVPVTAVPPAQPPSNHNDVSAVDNSREMESRTQSPDPKRGSTADPIVLDGSSSDSETDTDEDIPATLPPTKAQSTTRGLVG